MKKAIRPPIQVKQPQLHFATRVRVISLENRLAYQCTAAEAVKLIRSGATVQVRKTSIRLLEKLRTKPPTRLPKSTIYYGGRSKIAASVTRSEIEHARALADAPGSHTESEWILLCQKFGNKCVRCGVDGSADPLTRDHVTPVSEGGSNTIWNIQPLCRRCNSWKGNREIDFRVSIVGVAVSPA